MKLVNDREAFQELVEAVSQTKNINQRIIEKDYMVSILLEKISKIQSLDVVFKGGTSLSKCYSVIDRFSEDIDLAFLNSDNFTRKDKRNLKECIIEAIEDVGFTLQNEGEIHSGKDFNQYEVIYPKLYEDESALNPVILIETLTVYEPFPTEEKVVNNYIYDFLVSTDESEIIEEYELCTFSIRTQTIERTFVDKVFALLDYHLKGEYHRYSRHIYDVHRIYESGQLNIDEVKLLIPKVVSERRNGGDRNPSSKKGTNFQQILTEIIEDDVYREDYTKITKQILFSETDYENCIQTLLMILIEGIFPKTIS